MSFFALAVLALGVASVVTDSDIISVPGLGPIPGVVGMLAAVTAFAVGLAAPCAPRIRPSWRPP